MIHPRFRAALRWVPRTDAALLALAHGVAAAANVASRLAAMLVGVVVFGGIATISVAVGEDPRHAMTVLRETLLAWGNDDL